MLRAPHGNTVFPYSTLFRSLWKHCRAFRCGWERFASRALAGLLRARLFRDALRKPGVRSRPAKRISKKSCAKKASKRSEEHTSELQSRRELVRRLPLEKKSR